MKRRALVLTDEAARHPFRRSLPAHIRASASVAAEPPAGLLSWRTLREFLTVYSACFVAVTVFVS